MLNASTFLENYARVNMFYNTFEWTVTKIN